MKRCSIWSISAFATLAATASGAGDGLDVTMRVLEDVRDVDSVIRDIGTAADTSPAGDQRDAAGRG